MESTKRGVAGCPRKGGRCVLSRRFKRRDNSTAGGLCPPPGQKSIAHALVAGPVIIHVKPFVTTQNLARAAAHALGRDRMRQLGAIHAFGTTQIIVHIHALIAGSHRVGTARDFARNQIGAALFDGAAAAGSVYRAAAVVITRALAVYAVGVFADAAANAAIVAIGLQIRADAVAQFFAAFA